MFHGMFVYLSGLRREQDPQNEREHFQHDMFHDTGMFGTIPVAFRNISLCLVCFAICLFNSPDLDGQGTKNETLSLQDPQR